MASNINPTNIDGNYPIAGQDNDSQGFRDNFTNIKTNFTYSKSEIEDLQKNVVLKGALRGTTLNNDFNYATLYRPVLKAPIESFREFPGTQVGPVTVSFLDAAVQQINTPGPLILNFADFPIAGNWGSVKVWFRITFNSNPVEVVLPDTVTMGINRITNYNSGNKTLVFTASGDYLYEFSSADSGNSFWIRQIG
jgi:hypothetical protein